VRRHHRRVRRIADTELFQIKGAPYSLARPARRPAAGGAHRNGRFITLRLTSSMYHRFHAPHDCRIEQVTFIHGDTWNVNPIALKRSSGCSARTSARSSQPAADGEALTLVPVARSGRQHPLHFLDRSSTRRRRGRRSFLATSSVRKGEELGWFEHGSTIIVLAPDHFEFCENVVESARIYAGQPLIRKSATRVARRDE
jgi:phosphatidylserine decarboxylase